MNGSLFSSPALISIHRLVPGRRALGIGLALWFALAFLGRPDFWGKYTESRRAEISREMMEESGNLLVPTLLGQRILTKPPGFYWLQILSFRLTGRVDTAAARLPGALLSLAALWAVAVTARREWGAPAAWPAAGVLATSYLFLKNMRSAEIDMVFCALLTFEYALLLAAYRAGPGRRRLLFSTGFWGVAGIAFMVKGPLCLLFPFLGVLGVRLLGGPERRPLRAVFLNPGPAVFLALALPWYLYVLSTVPHAFDVFARETMGRLGPHTRHVRSVLFYFENLTVAAPWVLFLPFTAAWAWKERRRPAAAFLLAVSAGGFLLLTLLKSKKQVYLLPLLPAWSLLAAGWFQSLFSTAAVPAKTARYARVCLGLTAGAAMAGAVAAGVFLLSRSPGFAAAAASAGFGGLALAAGWGPFRGLRKGGENGDFLESLERSIVALLAAANLGMHWVMPALNPEHSVRRFAMELRRVTPATAPLAEFRIENYALSFYARRIIPNLAPGPPLAQWRGWLVVPRKHLADLEKAGRFRVRLENRKLAGAERLKSSYDLVLAYFQPGSGRGG